MNVISENAAQALFEEALDHHRQGRFADAEKGYSLVLAADPDHAGALHYLGLIAHQGGNHQQAETLIRRALDEDPDHALFHNSLGGVLLSTGRVAEATECFRESARLKPDFPQARSNLSAGLHNLGQDSEAEAEALEAIKLQPQFPDAYVNLGNALESLGKSSEALESANLALELQPNHGLAHAVAGSALFSLRRSMDALNHFDQALTTCPNDPVIHMNRGNALLDLGQLNEAISASQNAVKINPALAIAHAVLGGALKQQGRIGDAQRAFRNAMAAEPDRPSFHSDLLFAMHYDHGLTTQQILLEAEAWDRKFCASGEDMLSSPPAFSTDNSRPLRIGYVSADLRQHSVGYFMEAILRHHDPNAVEVFCYSNTRLEDERSALFKSLCPHWTNITQMSDEVTAKQIRDDEIDILIDLSGHTGSNRLPLFTRRPAPVQVTYLGFPGTTGLDTIDYRLTDAVADPEGADDGAYSETLMRLPSGFLCYTPPDDAPQVIARGGGPLTFGSFNNVPKINDQVIGVWSRILEKAPGTRLFLKHRSFSDGMTRQYYEALFSKFGISVDRLTLAGFIDGTDGHLAAYGQVDVALDTFPYNGTTTTTEALWMGVPVVTLAGDRHGARVSASLLTQAGLTSLIAPDIEGYVSLAVDLMADEITRKKYRLGLRERLKASALMDGSGFTRTLEEAYRHMWREKGEHP